MDRRRTMRAVQGTNSPARDGRAKARMCRFSPSARSVAAAAAFLAAAVAVAAPPEDAYLSAARHYAAGQWQQAALGFLTIADSSPDKERAATARFYAGEALVQLGKFDEAQRRLTELLERAPDHRFAKTARFRVGECLLLAGKSAEAIARLEEFRAAHPRDELCAYALVYLGDLALGAGQTAEALSRYEQALREYPTGPLAVQCRFGIGRCKQAQEMSAEAIVFFEQVASAVGEPLADDARLQLGVLQYRQRDFHAAERSLGEFESRFHESELRPQALYWLGLTQLADRRPLEAAATLHSAIRLLGQADAAAPCHAALVDAFRQAGDLAAADAQCQLLLVRWPQGEWTDDALFGRLSIAEQQGDQQRAESLAGELIRRCPESPHKSAALLIQSRLHLARREYSAAEPPLAELVAAAGANVDQARYYLGLAQLGQQKLEASLATLAAIESPDQELEAAADEVRTAALLGLKRYEEAAPLLRKQLAAASDPPAQLRLRTQLVAALAELGQLDEAAAELDRIAEPNLADAAVAAAILTVAERAYRSGNSELAKRWFEALSKETAPAEVRGQALSGLAWIQLRSEGKQASSETFERVLRSYPDSPLAAEAALVRGHALAEQGQHDAALTAYRLVIDRYSHSPHLPAALLAAARLHDRLDQDREAAELLERLVKDHAGFAELDGALYALAWVLADQGRTDDADARFERLSSEFPQSRYWADATYRLAQRAAGRKEHALAAELTERLIAADCEERIREHALYLRGQTAAALGRWDELAQFMTQLIARHPASPLRLSAEFWLAEADFRRNQFAAAREKFERLLAQTATTGPGSAEADRRAEAWTPLVPLRRAQCLAQERKWPEALAAAEAMAAENPQSSQQHEVDFLIGRCLSSQGRLEDARAAFRRVVAAPTAANTETAATAQWMIGETLFHQKRYEEAIAAYERCGAGSFPRWQAAGLLQAGKCRLLLGQKDRAIADFLRIVDELSETPYAGEARQRLSALGSAPTAGKPQAGLRTQ
jgi:TolA-binding protein